MEHKEQRQEGHYWIKESGEWKIAFYSNYIFGCWYLTGDGESFQDREFEEIDERKIERHDPTTEKTASFKGKAWL